MMKTQIQLAQTIRAVTEIIKFETEVSKNPFSGQLTQIVTPSPSITVAMFGPKHITEVRSAVTGPKGETGEGIDTFDVNLSILYEIAKL